MKTNRLISWFLTGLSLLTTLAFVGATTGTLAWYAYSTRASLSYRGVSVSSTEQLQIGIRDSQSDPRIKFSDAVLTENNCYRDGDIVWARPGSDINQKIISGYLSADTVDSYFNSLLPVTTKDRDRTSTSEFKLYNPPTAGNAANNSIASRNAYVSLPLVFRVLDNESNYIPGKKVWISRVGAQAMSAGKDITSGLRIFTSDAETLDSRQILINPSQANDGSTIVAGLLDLNGDGYYDHGLHDSMLDPYEVIYGSYTGTPSYSARIAADTGFDDINQTGATDDTKTTFYAKHKENNHILTSYSGLTLGEAEYYGMTSIQPVTDPSTGGYGNTGMPVSVTDSTTFIASLYLTIFLEGWDHAVIDQAIGCRFNLGLTFEIE